MSHIIPNIWDHTTIPNHNFGYTLQRDIRPTIPKTGYFPHHVLHKAPPSLYGYETDYLPLTSDADISHLPLWNDVQHKYEVDIPSAVKGQEKKFQAVIDVQQFSPDEVTVKVIDDHIVVEGNHDEKKDDHGYIKRTFIRRYKIPEDCDVQKIESKISSDGVMLISIPSKHQPKDGDERVVPIQKIPVPACLLHDAKPIKKDWIR